MIGTEHAHWNGHFHGYVNTLRAILEYAIVTNDARLKAFIRDGYEWARQRGWARIGYVGDGQGVGTARLIGLAVKLTDTGVGDYWEDVDQYIRNHGIEMQLVPEDGDYLRSLAEGQPPAEASPDSTSERMVERNIGAFPAYITKHILYSCCGTHGNMGLFYAWEGALRHRAETVRVNLLVNRTSPWMDVDSDLPYAGRVVIKNKDSREAYMRVPLWVDKTQVACRLRDRAVEPVWFGNYLRIAGLEGGDAGTIKFPVEERTERHTIPGEIGGGPSGPGGLGTSPTPAVSGTIHSLSSRSRLFPDPRSISGDQRCMKRRGRLRLRSLGLGRHSFSGGSTRREIGRNTELFQPATWSDRGRNTSEHDAIFHFASVVGCTP